MILLSVAAGTAMADGLSQTVKFLATYRDELVALKKPSLESILKSHGAKRIAAWKAAQNFWVRRFASLNIEQRALLEDWEFLLCDTSALTAEVVASRLGRCFNRAETFLVEQAEAFKNWV